MESHRIEATALIDGKPTPVAVYDIHVPTWQSIETAPKVPLMSLHPILVWTGQSVDLAFWSDHKECWLSSTDHDEFEHTEREPTHWMPLPPPPNGTAR
jgi:hypothetical protein